MSRHFSIDSLRIHDGRVFGWGWFLDTESRLSNAEVRLPLVGGGEAVVACLDGAAREDVVKAFPGIAHAAAAGFMLMAGVRAEVDPSRPARFVARLETGEVHEIPFALGPLIDAPVHARDSLARIVGRARELGVRRTLAAAWESSGRARAAVSRAWWREAVLRLRRPVTIVFDHAMGGGANAFRDQRVRELQRRGQWVLLVTARVDTVDYAVRLLVRGMERAIWTEPTDASLIAMLDRTRVVAIEVNNLVSFGDPLAVIRWCIQPHDPRPSLTFYLHDFHSVCPAFTLINADGKYCGIPSLDVCAGCMPRNAANSLGFGLQLATAEWRAAWGMLLRAADRVVAFSEASVAILARAYPESHDAFRIDLQPHTPDHSHLRPVQRVSGARLRIGVIGNISRPKGAGIVEQIAAIARARGLDAQVVVIGTLQASQVSDDYLLIHGPFQSRDLPDLLERYGVNVCLMPSVCPETYSYVTDEIMAMGLPLAVFDIGAPAERVARYRLGHVIGESTAEAALADMMRLLERTAVREAT